MIVSIKTNSLSQIKDFEFFTLSYWKFRADFKTDLNFTVSLLVTKILKVL